MSRPENSRSSDSWRSGTRTLETPIVDVSWCLVGVVMSGGRCSQVRSGCDEVRFVARKGFPAAGFVNMTPYPRAFSSTHPPRPAAPTAPSLHHPGGLPRFNHSSLAPQAANFSRRHGRTGRAFSFSACGHLDRLPQAGRLLPQFHTRSGNEPSEIRESASSGRCHC